MVNLFTRVAGRCAPLYQERTDKALRRTLSRTDPPRTAANLDYMLFVDEALRLQIQGTSVSPRRSARVAHSKGRSCANSILNGDSCAIPAAT